MRPISLVDSGGIPITEAENGEPMTPVDAPLQGEPMTLVDSGGHPVVLVNDDLSAYEDGRALLLINEWMNEYWDRSVLDISFRKIGGVWTSNFNSGNCLPLSQASHTYYVDVATGNDADDGSTADLAFKSIHRAHTVAGADAEVTGYIVYVKAGRYNRSNGINNSGTVNPTKPCWIVATDGVVRTGTFEALTWTNDGSGTNTYQATRSNVSRVISTDSTDAYGNHPDHTPAADLATLRASSGVNGMFQDGATIYVKRADAGTVSDSNTLCTLIVPGGSLTKNFYMSGVEFFGGHNTTLGCFRLDGVTANAVFEDCSFKYPGSTLTEAAGLTIEDWTGYVVCNRCDFGSTSWDGINPHWYAGGDPQTYVVLLNCTGGDFGRAGGGSYNAVTSHNGIPVIDMNGDWERGRGGTVSLVQQAKYLGISSISARDIGSSLPTPLSPSQFRVGDAGTVMYLIDCTAIADPDTNLTLVARDSGVIKYHRLNNTGAISSVGATIEEV